MQDCVLIYWQTNTRADLTNKQILCAGGEEGKDACAGDSGNVLMALDTSGSPQYYAVGLVSFGPTPCGQAGIPSMYTKVSEYVDWIQSNIH